MGASQTKVENNEIGGGPGSSCGGAYLATVNDLKKDLSGKTFAVTGGNAGIGFQVVQQLAKQNADVIMLARNATKAEAAIEKIRGTLGEQANNVKFVQLDLNSLASVRTAAKTVNDTYPRLDCLINNAGIMAVPEAKTEDGFEKQIGVNHLGPFLFTKLLTDKLIASAPSRIVNTSSVAHEHCAMPGAADNGAPAIDFDDLFFTERKYDAFQAYGQSKLANVLFTKQLATNFKEQKVDVSAVAVHPGWVASNLASHMFPGGKFLQDYILLPFGVGGIVDEFTGANTTLHAALNDGVQQQSGEYFAQTGTIAVAEASKAGGWPMKSSNPAVYDTDIIKKFWDLSEKLTTEKEPAE